MVLAGCVVLAGCATTSLTPVDAAPSASATPSQPPVPSQETTPTPSAAPSFDKSALSIDASTSLWVVVNKLRALSPPDYVPELVDAQVRYVSNPQMRPEAAAALGAMFAAAAAEGGGDMQIQNAYRSFSMQTTVHDRLVASLGREKAQAQSARPGHSEHQTGLALDIASLPELCSIQACFGQTPQGVWLLANSWRFGFTLRYPADKTPITGYIYEPWHFRYVGVEAATEMHATGVTTLEEFFGLPAAPAYAP